MPFQFQLTTRNSAGARRAKRLISGAGLHEWDARCRARRAIDTLLPGQGYVVIGLQHANAMIAGATRHGNKRFSQRGLPNGRFLITRTK